jgi:hypothetical protein
VHGSPSMIRGQPWRSRARAFRRAPAIRLAA